MKSWLTLFITSLFIFTVRAEDIHVYPGHNLAEAVYSARHHRRNIIVHGGTYYLSETLKLTAEDSGLNMQVAPGERVIISGGYKLSLQWKPYKDGIIQAKVPDDMTFDQLFVNGKSQMMARYPNYHADVMPYGGFSADAFSKERASRWSNPAGGYIHAMHVAHWGGYHYKITGKNEQGEITYEGGWQNNRPMGMHKQYRFVENIFEELDAPSEWYHNAETHTLYYYPTSETNIETATIEIVRLRHLIEFTETKNVTLSGFIFQHSARTFMDTKEPLLRSDWTVYRGGALLFNKAEACTIKDCEFDQPGGNAIFVNGNNRHIHITGCHIHDAGASAIAFVGESKSVRNPLFAYENQNDYADIDQTPGPKTDDYPKDCLVEDCLIHHVGVVEKQATGIEISMSMGITIRHCSIYDTSRAGINISEGTFGGHIIEFCDVFNTVKETGDHGSFNSWGRDRFWHLQNALARELPRLALLDVVKPNIIRNSRWRCDHGWDVDLDDGSSNYEIYNNLFLNGGLKLREGFHRKVSNNITLNNSFHPHVWYDNSGDIVTGNIWMGAYRPAGGMPKGKWGEKVDFNFFTTTDADRTKFIANGCDAHSLVGDPQFIDAEHGDFRVKENSLALKIGFKNFPMNQFGVTSPRLKAIALTPDIPELNLNLTKQRAAAIIQWMGAKVKELEGEEYSAFGVSKENGGVQLMEVPEHSIAGKNQLQAGDLIEGINGKQIRTASELVKATETANQTSFLIKIIRNQTKQQILMDLSKSSKSN